LVRPGAPCVDERRHPARPYVRARQDRRRVDRICGLRGVKIDGVHRRFADVRDTVSDAFTDVDAIATVRING